MAHPSSHLFHSSRARRAAPPDGGSAILRSVERIADSRDVQNLDVVQRRIGAWWRQRQPQTPLGRPSAVASDTLCAGEGLRSRDPVAETDSDSG